MRTTRILVSAAAAAALLSQTGCAMRQGDMTIVSTRNVNLDRVDLDSMPQVRQVTGETSRPIILFIPLGYPHLEDAIDDALDKGDGDVMTDAVIHTDGYWLLLFGENKIRVKGTVIDTKGGTK